jgi:hypothetical protein
MIVKGEEAGAQSAGASHAVVSGGHRKAKAPFTGDHLLQPVWRAARYADLGCCIVRPIKRVTPQEFLRKAWKIEIFTKLRVGQMPRHEETSRRG